MQLCLDACFWAVTGKTLQRQKCFELWAVLGTMQVRQTEGRERHSNCFWISIPWHVNRLQISVCCDSGSWLAEILCPRNG